jgi:hypothetical protein
MKTARRMAAQGDVVFRRVSEIPATAKLAERKAGEPLVVAHSETGHHHVIRDPEASLFTSENPLICYLRLETPSVDVEHLRPFDTHETLRLLGDQDKPACFEIRRQREHTPEGWRMVED